MVKRKQSSPKKSGKGDICFSRSPGSNISNLDHNDFIQEPIKRHRKLASGISSLLSEDVFSAHYEKIFDVDIGEVSLDNLTFCEPVTHQHEAGESLYLDDSLIQCKISMPVDQSLNDNFSEMICSKSMCVEFVVPVPSDVLYGTVNDHTLNFQKSSAKENYAILIRGYFSCPSEAVLGFFNLLKKKLIGVRVDEPLKIELISSWTQGRIANICVFVKDAAFDISNESILTWRKSMQLVMNWLRPETSIEALYDDRGNVCKQTEAVDDKDKPCNVNMIYDAVKPSGTEPTLDIQLQGLLPELRPYQRRAAYWMVQRERGPFSGGCVDLDAEQDSRKISASYEEEHEILLQEACYPVWTKIHSLDKSCSFFYNPFSGCISRKPRDCCSYVHGGILADEMGLGKSVELLACIMANPYESSFGSSNSAYKAEEKLQNELKKRKQERIDCPCGIKVEDEEDTWGWVQCDICDVWQHMYCVGYGSSFSEQQIGVRSIQLGRTSATFSENIDISRGRNSFRTTSHARSRNGNSDSGSKKSRIAAKKSGIKLSDTVSSKKGNEENFFCGDCSELIANTEVEGDSGATLIVCPPSILHQWQEEIKRHTKRGALRVLVYEGVRKGCFTLTDSETMFREKMDGFGFTRATELAMADIVLTTYDILRADLFHDADIQLANRTLRYNKRYRMIATPLTKLRWWRICLDEAQMVESSTARATEMALRLRSQHSWCITGTPIQCGLDDIFGLLRFLKAEPFNDYRLWTEALKRPYEEGKGLAKELVHSFLKQLMWRSSKAQVDHELNLPSQETRLSWLKFSAIERHFYEGQHEHCANKAREVRERITKAQSHLLQEMPDHVVLGKLLSHAEAAKLMKPILRLRQACCHPQVGSAGIRSLQKKPMTMEEILGVLIEKTRCEGEEALRNMVGALNGLAGLAIIENSIPEAVSIYREVLTGTIGDNFRVDPLQKLHTLHNLADILGLYEEEPVSGAKHGTGLFLEQSCKLSKKGCRATIPRTLRDSLLIKECQEIQEKYMSSFYSKWGVVKGDFESSCKQVSERELSATWWLKALNVIQQSHKSSVGLMKRICDSLLENDILKRGQNHLTNASSLALRFRDLNGLKLVLEAELDALITARERWLKRLTEIDNQMAHPEVDLIKKAGSCPQCQPTENGPLCFHCEIEELSQVYQNRLFVMRTSTNVAVSFEGATDIQRRAFVRGRLGQVLESLGRETPFIVDGKRGKGAAADGAVRVVGHPSEAEQTLIIIKNYAKGILDRNETTAASQQLRSLAAMRKEWFHARAWELSQRNILYALSELSMSMERLSLWGPGVGEISESEKLVRLHSDEIPTKNALFTAQKFEALNRLHRAEGQLRYLEGLAKCRAVGSDQRENNSDNSEQVCSISVDSKDMASSYDHDCPVCQEKLSAEKMVLPCGHLLCCKCAVLIVQRADLLPQISRQERILCPSCRRRTDVADIMYTNDDGKACRFSRTAFNSDGEPGESLLQVEGSYGTKVEAVVRRVLWIQCKEPRAKILIFSSWHDVLDVLEHALLANKITLCRVKGKSSIDSAIQKFKITNAENADSFEKSSGLLSGKTTQVLLLPIKLGANGLNLVEAQHVVLVEPLLNPGAEEQAINRVHRIGQQSVTFVHRFIILESVEESIYKLGQTKMQNVRARSSISVRSKRQQEEKLLTLADINRILDIEEQPTSSDTLTQSSVDDVSNTQKPGDKHEKAMSEQDLSTSTPPKSMSELAAAAAEARLKVSSKQANSA